MAEDDQLPPERERHAGGRPLVQDFTQELGDRICEDLADGMSIRKLAAKYGERPARFFEWFRLHPQFAEQYARARREQAHTFAAEVIDIADDATGDYVEDEEGNTRFVGENVQRARLRVDARKWIASKVLPKIYGEKLATDEDGRTASQSNLTPEGVIDGLVSLATEFPIAALPLRNLLQSALDRIPIPGEPKRLTKE